MSYGGFDEKAQVVWDFVRCQRPDGTYYGTSGKCRAGQEVAAKLAKLPKETLQRLAKSPKLSPDQKKMVQDAIKKPAVTADAPPAEKPKKEAKPAGKGKASPEEIATQKKLAQDLLKKANAATSAKEEEKLISQWKKEKAKYEKMAGINQGSGKAGAKAQDPAKVAAATEKKIKKLEQDAKTAAEEYKKHLEAGDMAKATAAYKKGQKISQQLDAAKGISKGLAEKAAADKKAKEEESATQKKINDRQLAANLSPTQKKAVLQYTEEGVPFGYSQLNQCSRSPKTCEDPAEAKKFAKQLDSALKALPKNDDGDKFYRGIGVGKSGPTAALFDALSNAQPGQRFKDPGYGSYSSAENQARGFQYGSSGRRILFVSRSKSLTPVNMYSAIQSENEAVLPRGTEQTIRKVTRNGDEIIVELD